MPEDVDDPILKLKQAFKEALAEDRAEQAANAAKEAALKAAESVQKKDWLSNLFGKPAQTREE